MKQGNRTDDKVQQSWLIWLKKYQTTRNYYYAHLETFVKCIFSADCGLVVLPEELTMNGLVEVVVRNKQEQE